VLTKISTIWQKINEIQNPSAKSELCNMDFLLSSVPFFASLVIKQWSEHIRKTTAELLAKQQSNHI
jgi:hypothetical protein